MNNTTQITPKLSTAYIPVQQNSPFRAPVSLHTLPTSKVQNKIAYQAARIQSTLKVFNETVLSHPNKQKSSVNTLKQVLDQVKTRLTQLKKYHREAAQKQLKLCSAIEEQLDTMKQHGSYASITFE